MNARNYVEQQLLFHSGNKYYIPAVDPESKITSETFILAISLNKELSRFNYSLSLDAINALMHQSPDEIILFHDNLIKLLDEEVGYSDFKSSEPFYPNFPEEVMSKSDADLYFNAMLYYAFSQTDNKEMTEIANQIRSFVTDDTKFERPKDFSENVKMKIITLAKENELDELMRNRVMGLAMSRKQFDDLKVYAQEELDWTKKLFGDSLADGTVDIPSHEIRAKLALLGYMDKNEIFISQMLRNAEDVLRFAAELTQYKHPEYRFVDGSLSFPTAKVKHIFKLSTADKKLVRRLLERCPDLFTSIWHRPEMFEKLKNRLNVNDNTYPRVKRAFDNLSNHRKVDEFDKEIVAYSEQEIRKACRQGDKKVFVNYMKHEPNSFMRHLVSIFESIEQGNHNPEDFINLMDADFFAHLSQGMTAVEYMKLSNFLKNIDVNAENPNFAVTYIAKAHNYFVRENPIYLSPKTCQLLADKLQQIATMRINATKNLYVDKTIYIDPELENRKMPLRTMRNASDRVTMTPFSTRDLSTNNNLLTMGIFWKNKDKSRADIDLSMKAFDKDGQTVCKIWYGHLKETNQMGDHIAAIHSGDYTSGMIAKDINGAVEYIICDKKALKEMGATRIVTEVNGFNCALSDSEDLRMIFSELDGSLDTAQLKNFQSEAYDNYSNSSKKAPVINGEIMDPKKMDLSYSLSSPDRMSIAYMVDLENDKLTFLDQPITSENDYMVSSAGAYNAWRGAILAMYLADHNDVPSIKSLADFLKDDKFGIKFTEHPEEADVIFTADPMNTKDLKKDVEMISSYEFEKLVSLFGDPRLSSDIDERTLERDREKMSNMRKDPDEELER